MLKAYHFVQGGGSAVDAIKQAKALRPAADRLSASELEHLCDKQLEEWSHQFPPGNVAILKKLIEREAWETREEERLGDRSRSAFECLDFIMGDLKRIFLSVGTWPAHIMDGQPNGFVFDALALVERGATVRDTDFLDHYRNTVTDLLNGRWPFSNPEGLRMRIQELLKKAPYADYQKSGTEAVRLLNERAAGAGTGYLEIVQEGSLDVDRAVETWKDGYQVPPA